jgi:hypothetical protein
VGFEDRLKNIRSIRCGDNQEAEAGSVGENPEIPISR